MNTTGDGYLFGIGGTANPQALVILGNASGVSLTYDAVSPNGAIPYNQWSHVAYVRSGNNLLLFANGTLLSTTPITASYKYNAYNKAVLIGASYTDVPTAWNYNGYVDESRLSKGIARWTTSFTPPTYPYEVTSAAFTYTITNPYGPLPVSVQFNDTTPDSGWTANTFYWDFGDGSTSTQENPSHSYAAAGTKTVQFQTWNNNMTSSAPSQNIGLGIPVPDFIGQPTSGTAALLVTFTDLTINLTPITWNWSFGDGAYSNDQNPQHVYANFGTYDVNLTATSAQGSAYKLKHNYIVTSTLQNQQQTWYTPHQVRIKIVDGYQDPLPGSVISVYYVNTSLPSANVSWLAIAYGIPASIVTQMQNSGIAMTGTTGNDGYATFTMHGSLAYNIFVTNTAAGVTNYTDPQPLYPLDNEYILQVQKNVIQEAIVNNSYSKYTPMFWETYPNLTYARINFAYRDTIGNTSSLSWYVWDANNGTYYKSANLGNPGTTNVTDYVDIPNIRGTQIWYNFTAVRSP
jgi:PKD repeat protein